MTSVAPHPLDHLRPRRADVGPDVLHRSDLSPLAWSGLHLDGVLVPLWRDASRLVGAPEGPAARASALASLVPARGALARLAAAWVHVGGRPPDRVEVLVASRARRPAPHPLRRAVEGALDDDAVVTLAGTHVTSLRRTGVDVARWVPAEAAVPVLRALLAAGLDPHEALDDLAAAGPGRGVRGARRLLAALAEDRPSGRPDAGVLGTVGRQARIAGSSAPRDPVIR